MPNDPTKEKRPSHERRVIRMHMEDEGINYTSALREYETLTAGLTEEEKQDIRFIMNTKMIMLKDAVSEIKTQKKAFSENDRRVDG
jgi:hypothetical protein